MLFLTHLLVPSAAHPVTSPAGQDQCRLLLMLCSSARAVQAPALIQDRTDGLSLASPASRAALELASPGQIHRLSDISTSNRDTGTGWLGVIKETGIGWAEMKCMRETRSLSVGGRSRRGDASLLSFISDWCPSVAWSLSSFLLPWASAFITDSMHHQMIFISRVQVTLCILPHQISQLQPPQCWLEISELLWREILYPQQPPTWVTSLARHIKSSAQAAPAVLCPSALAVKDMQWIHPFPSLGWFLSGHPHQAYQIRGPGRKFMFQVYVSIKLKHILLRYV